MGVYVADANGPDAPQHALVAPNPAGRRAGAEPKGGAACSRDGLGGNVLVSGPRGDPYGSVRSKPVHELLSHFGYPAVFLGTVLEGETFILLGGFLSHRGYLRLGPVILLAAFGAFSGDVVYFFLGRRYGRSLLEKNQRSREMLPWLESWMHRYQVLWIFGMRYLYGIRWLAAALAGSSGMNLLRFAVLSLPACLLWASVVGLLGYAAGEMVGRLLEDVKRYELIVLAVLALVVLVYALVARHEENRLSTRDGILGLGRVSRESDESDGPGSEGQSEPKATRVAGRRV
jgi:membrane protein DedA with SNARE-associated domain